VKGLIVPSILVTQAKAVSDLKPIENTSNDLYIPNKVRSALESAGINIEQIIHLTNKMEMCLSTENNPSNLPVEDSSLASRNKASITEEINKNTHWSEQLKDEKKPATEVVTISNKSFEVVQNISASNNFSVSKLDEPTTTTTAAVSKQRRRNSNIRYATIGNFTLPNSLRDKSADPVFSDPETRHRQSTLVVDSDVDSSSYSINSCVESNGRMNQSGMSKQILPARIVSQFKPVLNVHKRALTAPVTLSLRQLPNSSSIDSFVVAGDEVNAEPTAAVLEERKNYRYEMRTTLKHSPIEEMSIGGEMASEAEGSGKRNSNVDLSKSLPNRNKKKVRRGFI